MAKQQRADNRGGTTCALTETRMGCRHRFWLTWLWAGVASLAWAGPPLVTDDPEMPRAGGWECIFSHNIEKTSDQFLMAVPLFDLSYSFTDQLQLTFAYVPILSVDAVDEPVHWGVGDLGISLKYLFLEQDDWGFMASVCPEVLIPTGNEELGLGDGRVELFLPIELGRRFFDNKLFLWAEVGLLVVPEDTRGNSFQWGVAGEWEVSDKVSLLAEVGGFAFSNIANTAFESLGNDELSDSDHLFFNVGFWYVINENVSFLTSAGSTIGAHRHDTPELLTFVGFQITWGEREEEDRGQKSE
jgi:hypothetical protein